NRLVDKFLQVSNLEIVSQYWEAAGEQLAKLIQNIFKELHVGENQPEQEVIEKTFSYYHPSCEVIAKNLEEEFVKRTKGYQFSKSLYNYDTFDSGIEFQFACLVDKTKEFEVKVNDYETEYFPEVEQRAPNCRKNKSLLDLFSPDSFLSSYPVYHRLEQNSQVNVINTILHHSNPAYKKKETEGNITLSYKIYYFDLATSTSFLSKKDKEEFKIGKVKTRSCELLYGKENEKGRHHEHFIRETGKEKPTEIKSGVITYRGFNKDICHSLDKMGSGYLKYKTLESLVENIDSGHVIKRGRLRMCFPLEVRSTILLIDEPEVFLHPSLIAKSANLIKEAAEKDVTIILTTHSPSFLLHFVDSLFDKNKKTELVVVQKDDYNLKNPLYFQNLIKGNVNLHENLGSAEKRIKKNYEEFADKKRENVNDPDFYPNK
ncbi:13430_t:CDS:2, partial [Funneliformis geosporum]